MIILKKEAVPAGRLTLKPISQEDRSRLAEMLQNERITRTFVVPDYPSAEQYLTLADNIIKLSQPDNDSRLEYGIYLGDTLIGSINDCGYDEQSIEIGYFIHPDYQGRGYATEALSAVLTEVRRMGFPKAIAGFFEENPASRKVMEKCGMHLTDRTETEEYRGKLHRCLYCEITFHES